jgi:hypothetical protein
MSHSWTVLQHQTFLKQLEKLSPQSDRVLIATAVIGTGCEILAGYFHPTSGKFWVYFALICACSLFIWAQEALRDQGGRVIGRIFFMGVVAGTIELLVDWVLIHGVQNGKLHYVGLQGNGPEPVNDVVLLGSPIWMPLSWACLITNLGYFSVRLYGVTQRRLGARFAAVFVSLATGIVAGAILSFNESHANAAQWWQYDTAVHMLYRGTPWQVPLCIPLGECFQFLALFPIIAFALRWDEDEPTKGVLAGGFLFGIAIAAGYTLAYMLLEFGRTPA